MVTPRAQTSAALPLCVSMFGSQHSGGKKWKVPAVLDILSFSSKGAFNFSLTPKSQNLATNGTPSISSFGRCLFEHRRMFYGLMSRCIIPATVCKYANPLTQSFIIFTMYFWHMNLSPETPLPPLLAYCVSILMSFGLGTNLKVFSFHDITSLYFASSIIMYSFSLYSSSPSSPSSKLSSITSYNCMQFSCDTSFITSISLYTASSCVQIIIPCPLGFRMYYLFFRRVILLNRFIAYYWLGFCEPYILSNSGQLVSPTRSLATF